jgi:8-oxo-dGTP pyrophosphatase MutT (NUDIX family)
MKEKDLDIVVAGYIVDEDRLLLIHHRKLDKWLPVGGHLEENETPCQALKREIMEEVGIEVEYMQYPEPRRGNNKEYPMPFYVNKHHITNSHLHYCLFYLCRPQSPQLQVRESEIKAYSWLKEDELSSLVPPLNNGDLATCIESIHLAREIR